MGNFTYSNSMISTHHHISQPNNWVWSLFRTSRHHNNNHFPQERLKRIDISNSQLNSTFPPPKKIVSHSSRFQHFTRLFQPYQWHLSLSPSLFFSPSRWVLSNRRLFPRWSHIPTPLTTVDFQQRNQAIRFYKSLMVSGLNWEVFCASPADSSDHDCWIPTNKSTRNIWLKQKGSFYRFNFKANNSVLIDNIRLNLIFQYPVSSFRLWINKNRNYL